jgi:hypothetical protein
LKKALEQLLEDAAKACAKDGIRSSSCPIAASMRRQAPIPALLATSAVHHHLIREGTRTQCGLVVETGEARESHHFLPAHRLRRGRDQSLSRVRDARGPGQGRLAPEGMDYAKAKKNYIKAANKAILKVASKMGISTVQSYRGRADLRSDRLAEEVIDRYFTKTPAASRALGWTIIARESLERHRRGFPPIGQRRNAGHRRRCTSGGATGEWHMWNPDTVAKMQAAVRATEPARSSPRGPVDGSRRSRNTPRW